MLREESESNIYLLICITLVSGLSNSALLIIINQAAENDSLGRDNSYLFIICIICVALYLFTSWYVQRKSSEKIEEIVRRIRVRIINKIRCSELRTIEELGPSEVYGRITTDAIIISQSIEIMVQAFQSAMLVFFSFIYIGMMAFKALIVIILMIVLSAFSFYRTAAVTEKLYSKASQKQNDFLSMLNGILLGFKEIKVNSKKSNDAFRYFKEIARETSVLNVKATYSMISSNLISRFLFYLLLMAIIFIIPTYEHSPDTSVVKISAAILFILGPLEGLISAIPQVVESNASAINIDNLEKKIEGELNPSIEKVETSTQVPHDKTMAFNQEVKINGIEYQYQRKYETDGFIVGPIDLTIPKGQITFITGGNGSGKSTFLKLLCGLYYPKAGEIMVDHVKVESSNYQNYREMLAIVLTDFHLFQRLFGLPEVYQEQIDELLRLMQIDNKTQITEGKISNLNLSTGQRKRLALVIALLENKPFYVFDEIAADQDPIFKKFFYNEILKQMQSQGKTIIMVTHDNEYFHSADACYKLQNGQLSTLKTKQK